MAGAQTIDTRFGITSGEFDGVKYSRNVERPMFLKSDIERYVSRPDPRYQRSDGPERDPA